MCIRDRPKRIRDAEAVELLQKQDAEIFIVAAFGQLLPKEVLDIPPLGCVNVHASLLPKYRGADVYKRQGICGKTL